MKHTKTVAAVACMLLIAANMQAQSWSDLFNTNNINKVVNAVTGKESKPKLVGTWTYSGAACEFETDNLLKKAGGSVAATAIEKELNEQCAKVGMTPGKFGFTFNADSTFVNTYGSRKYKGTYSYDATTERVQLKYARLIGLNANAETVGNKMELTFKADALLKLLAFFGNKSSSGIIKTAGSLAKEYDGMWLGFELKKR